VVVHDASLLFGKKVCTVAWWRPTMVTNFRPPNGPVDTGRPEAR
jgi:hypothetical protein